MRCVCVCVFVHRIAGFHLYIKWHHYPYVDSSVKQVFPCVCGITHGAANAIYLECLTLNFARLERMPDLPWLIL